MITIFVALVLLPAIIVVSVNVWISVRAGVTQIYDQLDSVASLKVSSINEWAIDLQSELADILARPDERWHILVTVDVRQELDLFRRTSYNRVNDAFHDVLLRTRRFDELLLLDVEGNIVLSTTARHEGTTLAAHQFFSVALRHVATEPPTRFFDMDSLSIVVARPIVDDKGTTIGVIAGRTGMRWIDRIMQARVGLGETGETYLVRNDGVLLTPIRAGLPIGSRLESDTSHFIEANGSGMREHVDKYIDTDVVGVKQALPDLGMLLIAQRDLSESLSPTMTALGISLAVTSLAVLAAIMLGIILTRHITRPLSELTRSATRISNGQLDVIVSADGSAEINRLTEAFNTMTVRLRKVIEDLQLSDKQQRDLMDNTSSLIDMKDLQGRYVFVNRAFEEAFDFNEARLLGKTAEQMFPAAIATQIRLGDSEVVASGSLVEREEVITQADGDHTYLSVRFPLKNARGEIYAVCGIATDITARKRQEEELQRLRNYLANIIDSMPSILIGVDSDGRVTQWNREVEHVSGIPNKQAIGQQLQEILPRLESEMDRVFTAIKTRTQQKDLRRPIAEGHETRYEDITIYPLIANGVEGAVIRIDDVTERQRIEEMMIQSEKMLSTGGLAAGMAHEINNPLGGIMQTSEVLIQRLTSDLPANQRSADAIGVRLADIHAYMEQRGIPRMLDTVRDSCRRAAAIVDNMLSFARRSDAIFVTCNLRRLVDQTIQLCRTDYDLKKHYDFKKITVDIDCDDDLPEIECEPQKVQQVLLNVLKNGAQAMQEKLIQSLGEKPSKDETAQFWVKLTADKEASMVRIEIRDNGPGMSDETRKRVFEPFFTTKPPGLGTGLGLSVSYFIVTENLGGTMSVESQPGQGTTFIIQLPFKREPTH